MEALLRQLYFELERFDVKKNQIETLFIGGGTPSTVSPSLYVPIFDTLKPYMAKEAEMTAEANPNSATQNWLSGMHALGINRISFGVQSFDADKLYALNRAHTPKQAIEAIETAHKIGIPHLSLDFIYNYQGDTHQLLSKDIEQSFLLPIDHISAYELTIESNTLFESTPNVRQESEELGFFVAKEIVKRGFTHYEISNFGRYQSRHNKGYWEQKNYIGVGAGAVGFLKNSRFYPSTSIDGYIDNPLQIATEPLSTEELLTEKLFLGLRSLVGVQKKELPQKVINRAKILCEANKLYENKERYYNPNFFISDEIVLFLLS